MTFFNGNQFSNPLFFIYAQRTPYRCCHTSAPTSSALRMKSFQLTTNSQTVQTTLLSALFMTNCEIWFTFTFKVRFNTSTILANTQYNLSLDIQTFSQWKFILPQQNQFQLAIPLLFTLSHMYKHLIPQ